MFKLEYIWIDGTEPTAQLRSKTKVLQEFNRDITSCPVWSFDGSSTNQAPGSDSDCVLKPMKLYENPMEKDNFPQLEVEKRLQELNIGEQYE